MATRQVDPVAGGKIITLTEAKKIVAAGSFVCASHLLIGSQYYIAMFVLETSEDLKTFINKVRGNRFIKGVTYRTCKEQWQKGERNDTI